MILPRTDSIKPPSALDQKTMLSRLSKRELEEVHAASTHYPHQDYGDADVRSSLDRTSEHSSEKSAGQKPLRTPLSDSLSNTKKSERQQFKNSITGQEKKNHLISKNFYSEKERLVEDSNSDVDQSKDELDHDLDHLPSPSSLAGGATALLSPVKSLFQPYPLSASLDDDRAIVSTAAATVALSKEGASMISLNGELSSLSGVLKNDISNIEESNKIEDLSSDSNASIDAVAADLLKSSTKKEDEGTLLSRLGAAATSVLPTQKATADLAAPTLVEGQTNIHVLEKAVLFSTPSQEPVLDDDGVASSLDLGEQLDDVSSHDQQGKGESVKNLEVRGKITSAQDAGDNTDFTGTQHERTHEVTHKMVESEENNATMARSIIARAEIAPVVGSASSSGTNLSESVAAALRVTHLLDELTAAVSRLRLDSSDGKEMTIQLRRDVLPETNIHIVSTAKQMEVSFFTSNASSNLLLNTHLTTLQNHLNSLCPGQVVNIQTQLTPSSGSSQMGSEQDHSRDDLASFDQGNRGNSNNDNDTL